MKNFNLREREIIKRAYSDAARICWERACEANLGEHKSTSVEKISDHLKELMQTRLKQILKYNADLPAARRLKPVKEQCIKIAVWLRKQEKKK